MKPKTNGVSNSQSSKSFQGEGPNWILIAGGALLSTLSIHLGYKLKQVLDTKQPEKNTSNGNGKSTDRKISENCHLHSNVHCFTQDEDSCFNCLSGTEGMVDVKKQPNGQLLRESDMALPLMKFSAPEYGKENGVIWASSPDRLELSQKPFQLSNSSDSPCISESGSDNFSKRGEVIQKLRQQLKRRDDMILEMQGQIVELQNSLSAQLSRSARLQSMLDAANLDLFDSKREIRRLRKAIADHCVGVGQVSRNEKPSAVALWPREGRNGHSNGYLDVESNLESPEKGIGDGERMEMLKREVGELKEVVERKEYLLQSYKEQQSELSMKIKELQQRLDSQLPNIL